VTVYGKTWRVSETGGPTEPARRIAPTAALLSAPTKCVAAQREMRIAGAMQEPADDFADNPTSLTSGLAAAVGPRGHQN
jgi:hypothetical protein